MGVKIRKEDSARIHGDHLRYKGRRSVFPPLYLSPLRVPVLRRSIYTFMSMCKFNVHVYTHIPLLDLYKLHTLYRDKRIYTGAQRVYIYVYHKHVYCIVLNPFVNVQRLISTGDRKFSTKTLVKFSISLAQREVGTAL